MSTLVDRLRNHRDLLGYDEPLLVEAAAEVARLTADLAAARDEAGRQRGTIARLDAALNHEAAERDGLAKALSVAIEQYDHDDNEGYYRPLDNAMEAARTALAALPTAPKEDA